MRGARARPFEQSIMFNAKLNVYVSVVFVVCACIKRADRRVRVRVIYYITDKMNLILRTLIADCITRLGTRYNVAVTR